MYICKFRGYCPEQGSGNIKLTFPNLVAGAKGLPVDNCSIRSWVGVTLSRIVEVCYLDSKAKSLNAKRFVFWHYSRNSSVSCLLNALGQFHVFGLPQC